VLDETSDIPLVEHRPHLKVDSEILDAGRLLEVEFEAVQTETLPLDRRIDGDRNRGRGRSRRGVLRILGQGGPDDILDLLRRNAGVDDGPIRPVLSEHVVALVLIAHDRLPDLGANPDRVDCHEPPRKFPERHAEGGLDSSSGGSYFINHFLMRTCRGFRGDIRLNRIPHLSLFLTSFSCCPDQPIPNPSTIPSIAT